MEKRVGDYIIQPNLIGEGGFSKVYSCTRVTDNVEFAIKVVPISVGKEILKKIDQEINILKECENENIIRLETVQRTEKNIYIVFEKCSCDLKKWLIGKKGDEDLYEKIMKDIANGMQYLNERGIVHRDLKLTNLLVKELPEGMVVKIADFGFATKLQGMTETFCGTPLYMAPEMFSDPSYNNLVDLWAIGVIMYELYYGKLPFSAKSMQELKKRHELQQLKFPFSISPVAHDLMTGLLEKNPFRRISFEEFFNHRYFKISSSPIQSPLKSKPIPIKKPVNKSSNSLPTVSPTIYSFSPGSFKGCDIKMSQEIFLCGSQVNLIRDYFKS